MSLSLLIDGYDDKDNDIINLIIFFLNIFDCNFFYCAKNQLLTIYIDYYNYTKTHLNTKQLVMKN